MSEHVQTIEERAANTIRGLAMDAIQKANSGHPGAPMGMADIAAILWGEELRHDPSDAAWPDRDRVVLSNGHASMLLYSALHLTGTSLAMEDLRAFRQWGSRTAGHPEYGEAPGIETTTGPLGQGFANAVGMAMAERWLQARFGELFDHRTWVLCGDGCLMEGISQEAASLAGHLGLGRLICVYDDNNITIDGTTAISFSEDVGARFAALGWHVQRVDGHDHGALRAAFAAARAEGERPSLICARTVIARGAPRLAGSNKSHGAPLGKEEVAATKAALGLDPALHFDVPEEVRAWFQRRNPALQAERLAWEQRLAAHPEQARIRALLSGEVDLSAVAWPDFATGSQVATRKASEHVLQALAAAFEGLVGGSADLAESNGTYLKGRGDLKRGDFSGRNVHWGIREHAMAAACNGISLHGGLRPFCATFLTFHDYMRPSVRLAALMHQPVIFVYTHDSVFVGEDGPTHQPIEHLMAMRLIPNLVVLRPADGPETAEAWKAALMRRSGPTALVLSRQNLPVLAREGAPAELLHRGGYVLVEGSRPELDLVLIATGSEVALAHAARAALEARGRSVRLVSLPSWELFAAQPLDWRRSVLPAAVPRLSVEAGVTLGWERYVGQEGGSVGIDRFGASAPGPVVAEKLGLNVPHVVERAEGLIAAARDGR